MLKKNKKFFIASCIVILLPMFAGFLLWDQLPAQVATHFGRNGRSCGLHGRENAGMSSENKVGILMAEYPRFPE